MSEPEDRRAKAALLGAARTIARAATIEPGEADEFSADDTIHSSAQRPTPVSAAAAALDERGPRYQKQNLLGEGGMGQVWLMRDARVGRRVAMKTIRGDSGSADAGGRERFLREARVQGQLEHPAVVPVYDLGTSPDGELFFTMKRVRGATLSEVIDGIRAGDPKLIERYSERRLLTAFSQVCLAVEFAHAHGVLHRDLKPDNLMLGEHGEVYVLDWGVARVLRDDLDDEEVGMATSDALKAAVAAGDNTGLVGTPGYIAPEKLRGKGTGPTADVYALGAILFELLTLRSLIGEGNVLSRLERTLSGVDAAEIIAGLDRKVPPELTALCVRATMLDPAARIQSARALHDAIEAYLDGERDQQLRHELAERHLTVARAASAQSSEDLDAHKRALRETGRALAIVPDHPEARRLILELFASTPRVAPLEVEAAIEAERAHQSRLSAKSGAAGMASMLLFIPILVLFGIRSWLGISIFAAMAIGAVAISAVASQQQTRSSRLLYLVVFFNNLVFGLCAGLYGPLVLVPTMVITNTITFVLHLDGWPRRFAVGSGVLAVGLPLLLTALGILPPSYAPSGDGILMRPLWLAFPPSATLAFITVGTLIAIVNGARSVAQVREALTQAERRTQMQRWQLSQLLPEDREPV